MNLYLIDYTSTFDDFFVHYLKILLNEDLLELLEDFDD